MSEVTTGTAVLSLMSAPAAIGAACIGAAVFAAKYVNNEYEKEVQEMLKSDERLKWLDKQVLSSPKVIAQEALRLQELVLTDKAFEKMTENMTSIQKNILAGAIVTENSPLRNYVPHLLSELPENTNAFESAIDQGTRMMAQDNFKFVNTTVKDAALSAGFNGDIRILKQTNAMLDIVFVDSQKRRFTAYCKLNKEMNPTLALDLEGFGCETNECTDKMSEIIKYLREHGVPFEFKRLKHNQPQGVLRNFLNKKQVMEQTDSVEDYLKGGANRSATLQHKLK